MKVVIAGGTGFIGRALVASLARDGMEVTVLSRRGARVDGARIAPWDGRRVPTSGIEALAGADAVVNLCGVPVGPWPWTPRRRRAIVSSRIGPTRALVEACGRIPEAERPRRLVNASGTDVYVDREEPASESSPPGPGFLSSVVLEWEAAALRATDHGVGVALMRTGLVVGRRARAIRVLSLPVRLARIGRIGDGRQWISWIDIDDTVALYRAAMVDHRYSGPVNVVGPVPVRQAEFASAMADVLGVEPRLTLSADLLRALLREQAGLLLHSRRIVPQRALDAGFAFTRTDLAGSLARALGTADARWQPDAG